LIENKQKKKINLLFLFVFNQGTSYNKVME